MRKARGVGDTVSVVQDGKDARVIEEARLPQHLETPEGLPGDRERGRPESHHGGPRGILDGGLGALNVLGEFQSRLAMDHLMRVAMTRDLATTSLDLLLHHRY